MQGIFYISYMGIQDNFCIVETLNEIKKHESTLVSHSSNIGKNKWSDLLVGSPSWTATKIVLVDTADHVIGEDIAEEEQEKKEESKEEKEDKEHDGKRGVVLNVHQGQGRAHACKHRQGLHEDWELGFDGVRVELDEHGHHRSGDDVRLGLHVHAAAGDEWWEAGEKEEEDLCKLDHP